MNREIVQDAQKLIDAALQEDLGRRGDITATAVLKSDSMNSAAVIAKQEGIVCGTEISKAVFHKLDPDIDVEIKIQDGQPVKEQNVIIELAGKTKFILQGERTALNFLGRLSGIATLTHQFVNSVSHTRAVCLDTRKTTPGWRKLEKYAVACGGGSNHRMGLYDMFLIKENHISAAGSIADAVERCRSFMKHHHFRAEIEVETVNLEQVKQAFALHVDRIMLDNMNPEIMRECVDFIDNRTKLEASGNVSLQTIRSIAETGVDFISVGALTHSAGTFDASLLLKSV